MQQWNNVVFTSFNMASTIQLITAFLYYPRLIDEFNQSNNHRLIITALDN